METLLEILIDNSSSMGYWDHGHEKKSYLLPDGSTRMELAKKVLTEEIIPNLDYAKNITLRIFHSLTYTDKTIKPIIDTIFTGELNKKELLIKIMDLKIPRNTGGTPITAAVKMSIDELSKYPKADRKIILVTDGEETDGGDYKKTVEDALKQHGIPFNIFIIGILQQEEAEEKSKALAAATGGAYVNLKAKVYDKPTLQTALRPIYSKVVETSLKNISSIESNDAGKAIYSNVTNPENEDNLQVIDTFKQINYSEVIEKNAAAFNLIYKQLSTLTDAIKDLKYYSKENEEVEITENSDLNERVRFASESLLFNKLKENFGTRIKWLNEENESGSPYDFEVIDYIDNRIEYFIECKASMYTEKVFYMTKNEWLFFLKNKSRYQLYFISSAFSNPTITKIDNLMEWILQGTIIPISTKNIKLKSERIVFTILD